MEILSRDIDDQWELLVNKESVTLLRRTAVDTFGEEIFYRLATKRNVIHGGDSVAVSCTWLLSGSDGQLPPRPHDRIEDDAKQIWNITDVRHLPFGRRYRCECFRQVAPVNDDETGVLPE